jgi:hypothetical protein
MHYADATPSRSPQLCPVLQAAGDDISRSVGQACTERLEHHGPSGLRCHAARIARVRDACVARACRVGRALLLRMCRVALLQKS